MIGWNWSRYSFNDLSQKVINTDALLFGCGFSIVFIYVQLSLGKMNLVEQRVLKERQFFDLDNIFFIVYLF